MDEAEPKSQMLMQKRLTIPLSDEEFDDLYQMSRRHQVSPAHLGQIAVTLMLISEIEGKFSMDPEVMFPKT